MNKFFDYVADMALKIDCKDCVVMRYAEDNSFYLPRCNIYQESCPRTIKDVYDKMAFDEELVRGFI